MRASKRRRTDNGRQDTQIDVLSNHNSNETSSPNHQSSNATETESATQSSVINPPSLNKTPAHSRLMESNTSNMRASKRRRTDNGRQDTQIDVLSNRNSNETSSTSHQSSNTTATEAATELKSDHKIEEESVIVLDERAEQNIKYRNDVFNLLLPIVVEPVADIIVLFCCSDDHILIPDNFDEEEFWKHWEKVESGNGLHPDNEYRTVHKVKLHGSVGGGGFLRCSRRGAITSRFGLIPTTHCKLLLECAFRFSNSNDFMTFTFRSNGKRSDTRWKVRFGILEMANCVIRVVQNGWSGPARIVIGDDDANAPFDSSKRQTAIPNPQPNELINVRIIYDGQNVEFECSFRGNTYKIQTRLADYRVNGRINRKMCKIAMNNRECPGNVVNITKLRVSMICDEEN